MNAIRPRYLPVVVGRGLEDEKERVQASIPLRPDTNAMKSMTQAHAQQLLPHRVN